MSLSTRLLTEESWPDFALLVEENNGVWGGCWCMGFHPEGFTGVRSPADNRERKHAHVRRGTIHQMLVYDDDRCVGWSQFGPPAEVANIKNAKAYAAELDRLPDWRMGCIFTGARHRGQGIARTAVGAALAHIRAAGGGLVEAYPEQTEERREQRGAYLHTGPESLYARFGFVRDRRIAKWRWVMRLDLATDSGATSSE
jgi:GNAT superfamily N-acetyltransferase